MLFFFFARLEIRNQHWLLGMSVLSHDTRLSAYITDFARSVLVGTVPKPSMFGDAMLQG